MLKFELLILGITGGVLAMALAINIPQQEETIGCGKKNVIDSVVGTETKSNGPIYKVKSGLAATDYLNDGNLSKISVDQISSQCVLGWVYYGSAFNVNAPISEHEDAKEGLILGLKAAKEGQWVSHYAMSPETNATLFRSVITNPNNITSGEDKTIGVGMYVQTTIHNGLVNYVSCGADANPDGIFWQVVQVIGNSTQGEDYRTLWRDESLNQPSTKDCKLITNGDNFLEVHLDNKLVYSNSSLDLQMPPPFNSYLELTTPSADEMRYGHFKDYYETYGKGIKLINLPANGSVQIIGNSNQLISNLSINSKGVVEFDLLQHPFPLVAKMRIYDSEGKIYASTSKEQHFFGGDIYSLGGP